LEVEGRNEWLELLERLEEIPEFSVEEAKAAFFLGGQRKLSGIYVRGSFSRFDGRADAASFFDFLEEVGVGYGLPYSTVRHVIASEVRSLDRVYPELRKEAEERYRWIRPWYKKLWGKALILVGIALGAVGASLAAHFHFNDMRRKYRLKQLTGVRLSQEEARSSMRGMASMLVDNNIKPENHVITEAQS